MTQTTPNDAVNHPSHYTQYPVEVIELTRHMPFNRGNAVKYVARAGYKGGPEKELEDIDKAIWYLKDERELVKKKLSEKKSTFHQPTTFDIEDDSSKKEASNTTGGTWKNTLIVDGALDAGTITPKEYRTDGAKG